MKRDAGQTFSFDEIKAGVEQHKPAVLFLCQVPPASMHPAIKLARSQHLELLPCGAQVTAPACTQQRTSKSERHI